MTRIRQIFTEKKIYFSLWLCVSVVFISLNEAQSQSPHFRDPLDIPIHLAANFGEIRANHYHTGYDIRTNEKTGYAVHAAAGGYISRISISPYGFGNALYIMHPNGFMTVYGHLDHFNEAIANYVKSQQYAKQSFAVELYPDASKFPVKEGDIIAYSGNSGSSEGPHLHFEIRDSHGETYPLNPKEFLKIDDSLSPRFSSLYLYSIDSEFETKSSTQFAIRRNDTSFTSGKKIITVKGNRIGLATEVNDFVNGSNGENGVYMLSASFDGIEIFSMKFDRLDFSNGRYVNAHLDYQVHEQTNKEIQRLYVLPGDHNTIYSSLKNSGVIVFHDSLPHTVLIEAIDDNGNTAQLKFLIKSVGAETSASSTTSKGNHFSFDHANTFSSDSMKLNLPANVLYTDLDFRYSEEAGSSRYFSAVHHVHDPFTPLHSFCDLYILPRKIPDGLKSKAVIVYKDENGHISSKTTRWEGGFLTTRIRDFGDYYVVLDTTKPKISPVGVKQNQLITANEIPFTVTDNLSGVTTYNAYLDGQWLLMEYDAKNNRMNCKLEDSVLKGEHSLKIIVRDEVNNESTYTLKFKR